MAFNNKWCVKSHFFLEHFKSVPDGQRLNIVVAQTGSVSAESVGPFLRLNSAMAHVDVGPTVGPPPIYSIELLP